MNYPDFFDALTPIDLIDPLAGFLGTFEKGEYTISYLDVLKGSGHSCPTVAGAYLMTYHALKALFPQETAVRGGISIKVAQGIDEGTTGVITNVISYITGATDKSGFKGLNGKFVRHSLMDFEQSVPSVRFTRLDKQKSVDVFYDPSSIKPDPQQMQLMQLILQGQAKPEEKEEFARLWQERVKRILIDNFDNKDVIRVQEV